MQTVSRKLFAIVNFILLLIFVSLFTFVNDMEELHKYEYFKAAFDSLFGKKWGGDQKRISIDSGLSKTTISMIRNGERKAGIRSQTKIANSVGKTLDEFLLIGRSLLSGQSPEPLLNDQNFVVVVNSQLEKDIMNGHSDLYRGIPLYESGKLAAGMNGVEFDQYETPISMVVVYIPELKGCSKHNLAALKVGGVSMEPTIIAGSIVVVDLSDKEYFNNKVFVVNTPECGVDIASVKRVQKWDDCFLLLSDNHSYPPVPSRLDWDMLCVGRVVWMWRDIRDV
jgi:phage repressor protein C with HTH and peptisase S24 domain